MKLPWLRTAQEDQLVVTLTPDSVAYVHAGANAKLPRSIKRWGVERRGDDSPAEFARRVRALALPRRQVSAVLSLSQYQLLQIEAPAVPVDELKAAARWHIKDMVDTHLDDLTLDVLYVGDDRQRALQHLFVVAAANSAVLETTSMAEAFGWRLNVIEIRETALRNLQSALAVTNGLAARATATPTVQGEQCLLTISAREELFYTRRLAWDPQLLRQRPTTERRTSDFVPLPREDDDILAYSLDTVDSVEPLDEDHEVSSLVIELQRTLDVWERSWPDLPLAGLSVEAPSNTAQVAALLQRELGLPVTPLDIAPLFKIPDASSEQDTLRAACLPLLGALLRTEQRKL